MNNEHVSYNLPSNVRGIALKRKGYKALSSGLRSGNSACALRSWECLLSLSLSC